MACQEFVCSFCCCHDWEYFQAKSLNLVLPLVFPPDLIQMFVASTPEGVPRKIEDKSPVEVVPSDFMKLPGRFPPPKSWVDAEGKTPGCKACDSGKGKHSVACQTRYSKWLESRHASGSKVVVPSPVGPEPDLLDDQQEVVDEDGLYSPTPPGSEGEGAAVAQDREKRRKVQEESSPDPYFTRRCPACESRMNVPGICHTVACQRKRERLEAQAKPSSVRPEVSASASAPAAPDVPAIADSPQGDDYGWLDHPMFDGPSADEAPVPMEFGIVDLCQCGVLVKPSCLSDSELVSVVRLNVESIAYDGSKGEFKVIDFCGGRVKLEALACDFRHHSWWVGSRRNFQSDAERMWWVDSCQSWRHLEWEAERWFLQASWCEAHCMSLGDEREAWIWRRCSCQGCGERHCSWICHSKVIGHQQPNT